VLRHAADSVDDDKLSVQVTTPHSSYSARLCLPRLKLRSQVAEAARAELQRLREAAAKRK
jgi:hypothetical protein